MLHHLKRDIPEEENYPCECDVPDEQLEIMKGRGWYEVKAEVKAEKKAEPVKEASNDSKAKKGK